MSLQVNSSNAVEARRSQAFQRSQKGIGVMTVSSDKIMHSVD